MMLRRRPLPLALLALCSIVLSGTARASAALPSGAPSGTAPSTSSPSPVTGSPTAFTPSPTPVTATTAMATLLVTSSPASSSPLTTPTPTAVTTATIVTATATTAAVTTTTTAATTATVTTTATATVTATSGTPAIATGITGTVGALGTALSSASPVPSVPVSPTALTATATLTPSFPALTSTVATLNGAADLTATAGITGAYGRLPLSFEPNQGQANPAVQYLSRAPGVALYLTSADATLVLMTPRRRPDAAGLGRGRDILAGSTITRTAPLTAGDFSLAALRLHYVGANPGATLQAAAPDRLPGVTNYLLGADPAGWRSGVPTYARVTEAGVYPGIDLVYYGTQGQLEYDWRVAPGADPGAIGFMVTGADAADLDGRGNLLLHTAAGVLAQHAPVAYQMVNGRRRGVDARYTRGPGGRIGLSVGAYDASQPLIIDPVLSYSTYLGGSGNDQALGVAVDGAGNAYLTGITWSTAFPGAGGPLNPGAAQGNAYVTKLDPGGDAVLYTTYLGGSAPNALDAGNAIAVDAAGEAYVAGNTFSTNFPTTPNAYQSACADCATGGTDAFVAKLSVDGRTLLYGSYLGGNGSDAANAIAVDAVGNAYLMGDTQSTNFPTVNALQGAALNPNGTAFVARFNPAAASGPASLVYSTYLGGSGSEAGLGIAVDGAGHAYVTGGTGSADFPTTANAYRGSLHSGGAGGCFVGDEAFVAELAPAGNGLVYGSYLGGSCGEVGYGIAVDAAGHVDVAGYTGSPDFPTSANAAQPTFGGGPSASSDAFVATLDPTARPAVQLLYGTYLGGNRSDYAAGIALDGAGNLYVTGDAQSANFPTLTPLQGAAGGGTDAFVAKIDARGALAYSTLLGGSGGDHGTGIAADAAGAAYVVGYTSSPNFPTANALQPASGGSAIGSADDAFAARILGAGSGAIRWHPHQGVRFADGLSANVDLADGHVDVAAAGLSIPARGPALTLARTWDSTLAQARAATGADRAWTSSLTPRITGVATGTMTYQDSGALWPFTYTGPPTATAPYTAYTTPAGTPWQLTASASGDSLANILTGETLTFDALGRLLADTDAYGNANTLTYGADGGAHASAATNSGDGTAGSGRALAFGYQNGLLADAQSPLWVNSHGAQGQHVTYGYAGPIAGELTAVTRGAGTPDALTATFGYSGTQLVAVTTPYTQATHTWTLAYDGQGRLTSITSPAAGTAGQPGYTPAYTTQFAYSPGQTQVVQGYGSTAPLTHTYTLDAQGQATLTQDGLGDTTKTTYDADHDVTSRTDANGNTTTDAYQYVGPNGSIGLLAQETLPATQLNGPSGPRASSTTFYSHNPTTYDLLTTFKPGGGEVRYGYDGHHGLVSTAEQLTPGSSGQWRGTVTSYDAYGEPVATTDGRGVSTDSQGNVGGSIDTQGLYTRHSAYDAQGDLTAAGTAAITTTLNGITSTATSVTTTYGYDLDGDQTRVTAANGGVTTSAYDHLGRQTRTTRPAVTLANAPFPVGATGLGGGAAGTIATAAGTGSAGYNGDGESPTLAQFYGVAGVAVDRAGNLYIADALNNRVREVRAGSGTIITVAGTGNVGYSGDGGPAAAAQLATPVGVAVDGAGNLYIADSGNHVVREVYARDGTITTAAGNGTAGSGGDGTGAISAQLSNPVAVAADGAGNLYIADDSASRVREVNAYNGIITTVAGTGASGYGGDGGPATRAQLASPEGVAIDGAGNLYIADYGNNRVREVYARDGTIVTVAGTGSAGYSGDGRPAASAQLRAPVGVAVDGAGTLYIADSGNHAVRAVVAGSSVITTLAGGTGCGATCGGDGGPATSAQLNYPRSMAADGAGALLIADDFGQKVRVVSGVAGTSAPVETTTYDGEGHVAATTDAAGATTTNSYDPLGRQVSTTDPVAGTSTTSYNATERVSSTDADGHVSQLRYDGAGRLVQASDPLTGTVQYQYDAVGNTVAITTGDSSGAILGTETRGYDARNRVQTDTVGGPGVPALVTTTWYDADGNVVQVVAPAGDAALTTYDLAGETLTTEDDPRVNAGPLPALQTSYGYDGAGNQVTRQDPDGRTTSTVYDGDNRVAQSVAVTGTSTVATTLGYDPNGNTVAQTVQTTDSAHPGQPQVSTDNARYDAADQQTSETADGLTTVYGYDATGQRRTQSLPTGGSVTRVTDAGGRVTEIDEAAPGAGPYSSVYKNYDNATGQARSFQLGDGVAGQRSFDGANRPTSVSYYNISDPSPNTALSYDTAGRVNSTTTLSGTDLLGYDGANRLVSESGPQLLVKSGARWTYDGNGNILTATDDTGATDLYTYSASIPNKLKGTRRRAAQVWSWRQQRAWWPGPTGRSSVFQVRQASVTSGQRGAKRQPGGMSVRAGGAPPMGCR